ncbi:hypothetical protein KAS31_03530 [Candidatus Parcubacteria bacterium]|nr:hypothetical protein [Candidatus Parcubacteria bacterium]
MKNKSPLESIPKLVMTITIIILIGALFGTLGYYLGSENVAKDTPADVKYQKNQLEKESEKETKDDKQKDADFLEKIADWKIFQDDPYSDLQPSYEFRYPNEFTLNLGDNPDYHMGSFLKARQRETEIQSVNVVVSATFPKNIYPETNFQSAWLAVAYDPDIANLSNCQKLENNGIVRKMTEIQTINGVTWYKGVSGSAALGTKIESRVYHTFHNNMCYEVAFHLSTANIGNFDPAQNIKAVDESKIWVKMEDILSTFKFTDTDETADWMTYSNKEYGFEMKFPQSWQRYQTKNRKISSGVSGKFNSVDFGFSIQESVFNINFRTIKQWNAIMSQDGPKPIYINKNDELVFAYATCQDPANQEIINRMKEIKDIISTFKFIDADKTNSLETYERNKNKIGSDFSFKYSPEVWNLEELRFVHKNLDGCILAPSVLWRNRLVNIISSEDITLSDYKARKVKIGIEDNASSIDYYFGSETSAVFSLSLPENKKDKATCEKDTETILNTISF